MSSLSFGVSMDTTKTTTYLDRGYLSLFADQIINAVNGAQFVAMHGPNGRLIWEGPDQDNTVLEWNRIAPQNPAVPGAQYRVADNHHVYVFRLGSESNTHGCLSLFVNTSNPIDFETIHYLLRPMLQCLERQFEINAELSAVRRLSDENQDGMNLLVELDEIENRNSNDHAMDEILTLCQRHFHAEIAAILVPQVGIRKILGPSDDFSGDCEKTVAQTLANLAVAAKKHNRVLLLKTTKSVALHSAFGSSANVCVVPVKDERDDIAGILVLSRNESFSRNRVRLARAVSSKLTALITQPSNIAKGYLPRHVFLYQVDNVLKRLPHNRHAMLYVDIDQLHVINDSFGHIVGDEAIKTVAEIITKLASKDDVIGHMGGDCFALFLRNSDEEKATAKASVILDTIKREPLEYQQNLIELNASIGIALLPDFAKDSSSGVNVAEISAGASKDRGGNRFTVFQDLDASVIRRRSDLDQVGDLQAALLQDHFVLYAQRIASLHRDTSKYEILIRMLDQQENLIPPGKFLSAAERYQMMSALDRWVLNRALEQITSSDNMLEINLTTFCINISGQSLADDDFLPHVEARIQESGLSPDSICFEITETAIVRNLDRAQRFIQQLRKLGCRFALDDFGTGYCSFAYLKNLPVQYLKLDGAFVRDLLDDALSEAIVKSITQIGRVMGAATVAEHVENELVVQKLRELGVDYVQGFAIGRPEPLADVLDRIDDPIDLGLGGVAVAK